MTAIQPATVQSPRARDNGFSPRPGFEPFFAAGAERSIIDRFMEVAGRRGDARAIVQSHAAVTYRELVTNVSRIGAALRDRLDGQRGPVAIQLPSGIAAVETLLGVLFSGRAYFFLPPESGAAALDDLLDAAVPAALIVADDRSSARQSIDGVASCPVIALDDLRRGSGESVEAMDFVDPGSVACLFATSGTTGAPKLVALSHRAVLFDTGRQNNDLSLGPDDRIDLLGHPSFSASLASIFTALLTGAELHIPDAAELHNNLGEWIIRSGITISTMTVSALRALCATLPPGVRTRSLRLVSVGGEPMFYKDVKLFHAVFPSTCVLQNAMASTETRTYAQYFVPRESPQDGAVPIGWPVAGKEVVVLGQNGTPVNNCEQGEIAVRSRYIADGYVNSHSRTAERFLPQPDGSVLFLTGDRGCFREDGCLIHHGRMDSMVKIRGYRIEPGAVETALLCDPRVRHAAVVAGETSPGEYYLAAYVVPEPDVAVSPDLLLADVAHRLQVSSVPSFLDVVESLPVTPNGKTDYRALRERQIDLADATLPFGSDRTVAALMQIWSDTLGCSDITADDNYFKCGGDSLGAIRLQVQIHRRFGIDPPLDVLVSHPSVNAMSRWLNEQHASKSERSALVTLNPGDPEAIPLFCIPGIGGEPSEFRSLAKHIGDRPVYGLRITAGRRGEALSIDRIAAECLREIDTIIDSDAPVLLCGHSFGAFVAFEIAHQLTAMRRPLGFLAIIDMPLQSRRRWWQRVRDLLRNLPAWLWYDAIDTDWNTLYARVRGKLAVMRRSLPPTTPAETGVTEPDYCAYFGSRDVPEEMKARLKARLDAMYRYSLRPLSEPIALFRARAQALFGRSDRDLGWGGFASHVEVHNVPGHHDSCMAEQHVSHIAQAVRARLNSVKDSGLETCGARPEPECDFTRPHAIGEP